MPRFKTLKMVYFFKMHFYLFYFKQRRPSLPEDFEMLSENFTLLVSVMVKSQGEQKINNVQIS